MGPALFEQRRVTWDGIFAGAARALWGLFKKLVIASRAGVIIGTISADPENYQGAYALAAMLLYSVQLYSDFSGGMDMVLGLSRMLGIRLSENFRSLRNEIPHQMEACEPAGHLPAGDHALVLLYLARFRNRCKDGWLRRGDLLCLYPGCQYAHPRGPLSGR